MGGGGSKEVVLPVAASAPGPRGQHAATLAGYEAAKIAAETAYKEAEDAIYQEGYKRGASEAVAKMDTEVERQARAAYAHAVVEDERKHTEALREQIDRLRKAQYRAPLKPTECAVEEAAVLSCESRCEPAWAAYTACADKLVDRLMHPTLR